MLNNQAKNAIAKAVTLKHLLIQVKAKAPKLFAKIQKEYIEAVESGTKPDLDKMLTDILES